MPSSDPIGDRIAAALTEFDVQKTRGRYNLVERRDGRAVARLKPSICSTRCGTLAPA